MRIGAFVITYERASILADTLQKILNQSLPPEKILVVDNSTSFETEKLISQFKNSSVSYIRVGYNAGPAGGARIGLRQLADEGFDWIYWGDDDDPPKSLDCFEKLLKQVNELEKPGIIGAVGHKINRASIIIERTSNTTLKAAKWVEVDVISGGMCMIVNGNVVRSGVLPDERLFYGFEELDFCLQVQHAGYNLYVLSELFEFYRANSKRSIELAGKRGLKKSVSSLWREYYSTRNLLVIAHKNNWKAAKARIIIRSLFKCVYAFRFGWSYGRLSAKFILAGLTDFFRENLGRKIV